MARRSINKALYNNVYSQHKPPNEASTLHLTSQRALPGLRVYRFVFTTKIAFWVAFLMCLSLLLQPMAFAYAQETGVEPTTDLQTEPTTQPVSTTEPTSDDTNAPTTDKPNVSETVSDNGDDEVDQETTSTQTSDSELTQEVAESPVDQPEPDVVTTDSTSTESQTQQGSVSSATTTKQSAATSTTATTTQAVSTPEADTPAPTASSGTADSSASSSDQVTATSTTTTSNQNASTAGESTTDDEAVADDAASTTTQPPVVVSTVQTDNVLAFNKNECTEVEDGSFYCQKISYDTIAEDDLFAAPDATGDMEIYVTQKGQQIKVTDNAVDDASPYYDARSKTVVWHRLIDDRYQIISYDVETGEEEQITSTAVNNMEPTRNGDYTVWQRWVQNNWEIILLNNGVEIQVTDSIEHDIAPHIRGDLIIWNVRSSDGTQSLMTYDIGSEVFNEIKDSDGVSVTNPRMLVMYEAQYQNGDTVIKGFDLVTGEVVPIERIPRDLPVDIPSPEATGEVRALPTNPQSEEELSSDTDLDTDEPVNDDVQYDENDLVLTASSTASTTPTIEVADYDLDLRPDDSMVGTSTDKQVIEQAAIPDVVVPPFDQNDVVTQASSTQDN